MTAKESTDDRLVEIERLMRSDAKDASARLEAVTLFRELHETALEAEHKELENGLRLLTQLVDITRCTESDSGAMGADEVELIVNFVCECLPTIGKVMEGDQDAHATLEQLRESAEDRWSDCLQLVDEVVGTNDNLGGDPWIVSDEANSADENDDPGEPEVTELSSADIGRVLSVLDGEPQPAETKSVDKARKPAAKKRSKKKTSKKKRAAAPKNSPAPSRVMDQELLEAYLDDAYRCLNSMEQVAMSFDDSDDTDESVRHYCRQLHTLKGASASVGLVELADYIHGVEEGLQSATDDQAQNEPPKSEELLETVDVVRRQIESLQSESPADPTKETVAGRSTVTAATRGGFAASSHSAEDSIRVRASQLDRLMDMLAELVVLRNRRESRVEQLKHYHNELSRCNVRLRMVNEFCSVDAPNRE